MVKINIGRTGCGGCRSPWWHSLLIPVFIVLGLLYLAAEWIHRAALSLVSQIHTIQQQRAEMSAFQARLLDDQRLRDEFAKSLGGLVESERWYERGLAYELRWHPPSHSLGLSEVEVLAYGPSRADLELSLAPLAIPASSLSRSVPVRLGYRELLVRCEPATRSAPRDWVPALQALADLAGDVTAFRSVRNLAQVRVPCRTAEPEFVAELLDRCRLLFSSLPERA